MRTPASIKGHPVHAILVGLPIGLWIFALVGDIAVHAGGGNEWRTVAFYCLGGGVAGALLAAIPGLIDLMSLPGGRTRTVGLWHMSINLAAVAVALLNFLMRLRTEDHSGHLVLTLVTIVMIGVSGWLGGKLVYEAGVGVDATARPSPEGAPVRSRA